MKHIILFSFVALMAGCAGDGSDAQRIADSTHRVDSAYYADSIASQRTVMPRVGAPDTTNDIVVAQTDSMFKAKIRFYFTRSYCGGARPTDEILQQYNTPALLTNSTLKLVNHFTGTEYKCRTGADGVANLEMGEGKYDVFFTKEINASLPTGFDPKCALWTNQLLYTVKVTNDGKMRDVTLNFDCNPCDNNVKMRQ